MATVPLDSSALSRETAVSVVIPTLGGEWLRDTIQALNQGTLVPAEIIISIPAGEAHRAAHLAGENVTILPTPCRGQVAQRAYGFRAARSPLVLQLDDDILLDRHCLERLASFIIATPDAAVGPSLHDRKTGEYRSFLVPGFSKSPRFESLLYWVINGRAGFQPGQIGRAGVNMGVPESGDWRGLGWLPGGCVLHHRERLVLDASFYPLSGRAASEDLFHCTLLTRNGVTLNRCGQATCSVDFSSGLKPSPRRIAKEYLAYCRRMSVFIRMIGGSNLRLYLFLVLDATRLLIRGRR